MILGMRAREELLMLHKMVVGQMRQLQLSLQKKTQHRSLLDAYSVVGVAQEVGAVVLTLRVVQMPSKTASAAEVALKKGLHCLEAEAEAEAEQEEQDLL